MKKILIISYYYSPANIMGAVRASKLSKYLEHFGYEVQVICSEENKLLFMPGDIKKDSLLERDTRNIEKKRIAHSKFYKILANYLTKFSNKLYKVDKVTKKSTNKLKKNSFIINLIHKLIHFVTFSLSILQDYDFLYQFRKYLKISRQIEYDVVISTYGPLSSHLVGRFLKKSNPKIKWIADFRDPIAQPTNGWIEFIINKRLERTIADSADKIVAVSQGYLDEIVSSKNNYKSSVITNGFDPDDYPKLNKSKKDRLFSFVYTGTTYGGRRDLKPIFLALKELIQENKIDKNIITFRYAGSEQNQVKYQASKFGLEDIVEVHDFVPRNEALSLQASSQILVVSTWNENHHEGVLPGKFLEYMMFNKPIIGIVNGSVRNSEIKKIIVGYQLGYCYEDINQENDFNELKKYIFKQYSNFLRKGEIVFNANTAKVNDHNYVSITEKFIRLIEE